MVNIRFLIVLLFLTCQAMLVAQPYGTQLSDSKMATAQNALVNARNVRIAAQMSAPIPVLRYAEQGVSVAQTEAQELALTNPSFAQFLRDTLTGAPFLSEVFGVLPARPSEYGQNGAALCSDGSCYRVEMYNFPLNLASLAIVHLNSKQVLTVSHFPNTQPDIPPSLKEVALSIAVQSKEVADALGYSPSAAEALMSDTKTALNRSRCERSRHLCVSPTFVRGEKALWAVVDLTELRIVGTRWTNVGAPQQTATERRVQNEHLTDCYCKKSNALARNDWSLNYILTSSDGLRVSEVNYKGKPVLLSAKLVDWHVNYSNTDGFGYSDAVGCPFFSAAAVIAIEAPRVVSILEGDKEIGFALEQNYFSEGWPTACNYNYCQRFEFYNNGSFRVAAASLGRGCGNNGTYRPVTRIAFANPSSFQEWNGSDWDTWQKEQWRLQTATTPLDKNGFQYRLLNENGLGFGVVANVGQFADGGRGDEAFTYVTLNKPGADEGESDLMTIGPCCNIDYHQGPEQFLEPNADAIQKQSLVLWYVPQLRNDDRKGFEYCWAESYLENGIYKVKTFPCFSGPLFVPIP